jgi:putative colanic acid biosynthesis UDP-glucose lipid carrier transferase
MDKELVRFIKRVSILLDYIFTNIAVTSVLFYLYTKNSQFNLIQLSFFSILVNLLWFLLAELFGLYNTYTIVKPILYLKKSLLATMLLGVLFIMLSILFGFSFSTLIETQQFYYFLLVAVLFTRIMYAIGSKYFQKQNGFINRALIIGYNDTSKKLADYLNDSLGAMQLVAFVDEPHRIQELTHVPVYSGIKNAVKIAKELEIDEIFSTIGPDENEEIADLIEESEQQCVRFRMVPSVSAFIEKGMVMDHYEHLSMFSMRRDPLEDVGNRIKKRLFDVLVSSFVVVFILSWLYPLLAVLIKLGSKGPILFKQTRSGIVDKPFQCFKFRTMFVNQNADQKQATKNDARVTKLGAILRKTSLDEFPQFINVLMGDMSIVGPRPHMLKHTHEFSQMTKRYMIRHLLKPGITGWAQVNSFRGEITKPIQLHQRVDSDLWYLQNWSVALDFKIVALTFLRVFTGDRNAY